ncbi:MAG: hypothetical protein LQ350_005662 [Teloschistes chrysophthalmus]|nr:MAG: hypothetical protein LQ350_005662 [Niorma chrysophthalma]
MPIKLPKAFPRRKSSGNALEELTNPPTEPSFRVFNRVDHRKSFDGGNSLKRMSQARPLSAGHNLENTLYLDTHNPNFSNRGSNGTNNSSSSGGHDKSSGRLSSSSTLPSSTDVPLDDKVLPNPPESHRVPVPAIPASHPLNLKAGGRAFSFGRRKPQSPASASPIAQPPQAYAYSRDFETHGRERALTETSYASGSTAKPPNLLDTSLGLGNSDLDDFGDMFENFGKRRSTTDVDPVESSGFNRASAESVAVGRASGVVPSHLIQESSSPASASRNLTTSYFGEHSTFAPSPIQVDRSRDIRKPHDSPYSWTSHESQDGLMDSPSLVGTHHSRTYEESPPVPRHVGPSPVRVMPSPEPSSPSNRRRQQRQSSYGAGLRRTSAYAPRRDSVPLQDEDAKLVLDSINASRRLTQHSGASGESGSYKDDEGEPDGMHASSSLLGSSGQISSSPAHLSPQRRISPERQTHGPVAMFDSSDGNTSESNWKLGSNETTPRAKTLELANREKRSSLFDPSLHAAPRAGTSPVRPDQAQKPGVQNKIMTPAQFERYRREQEMTRTEGNGSKADDSDDESDHYEDDDEVERNKELAKQRRKQEAHLAVYRQQMMKVTGEPSTGVPDLGPLRPTAERASASAPNFGQRTPTLTFSSDRASARGKASDDEDEDIPLGVLAAHGFPNKNRPPGAAPNTGIRYQSESYPPPPLSTSGMSVAGGSRLPAFAKNLPADPYYGAGLVNPSNREMPSFSNHGNGSQYGGPSPNLHPGGLVGVIAGEERARAMRRGSPNAQGNYNSPLPQGMPQMGMGVPHGALPMMSPGDEAQIQMSQQMTQMMQMQMQYMQQMQQMIAGGVQLGQQMPPGMPPMPPPHGQHPMHNNLLSPQGQIPRPMSHSAPSSPALTQQQQRAMSMMSPNLGPRWPPSKSVAPSMMSGALGPQGYSPSIAPSERSNIGQPSRYRPVSIAPIDEHSRPVSRSSNNLLRPGVGDRKSTFSSAGKTSPVPPKKVPSDDDDEEGWEEMKKKREKKASTWRTKKSHGNDLKDLYYPGT